MEKFSEKRHRYSAIAFTTLSHLALFIFFASFALPHREQPERNVLVDGIPGLLLDVGSYSSQYEDQHVLKNAADAADDFIALSAEEPQIIDSGDPGDDGPGELDAALQKLKGLKGQGNSTGISDASSYSDLPGTEPDGLPTMQTVDVSGRTLISKSPRLTDSEAEGVVIVSIIVDEMGKVKEAVAGQRGSTTQNTGLFRKAKEAALLAQFNPKPGVPEQRGTYTFVFTLE